MGYDDGNSLADQGERRRKCWLESHSEKYDPAHDAENGRPQPSERRRHSGQTAIDRSSSHLRTSAAGDKLMSDRPRRTLFHQAFRMFAEHYNPRSRRLLSAAVLLSPTERPTSVAPLNTIIVLCFWTLN